MTERKELEWAGIGLCSIAALLEAVVGDYSTAVFALLCAVMIWYPGHLKSDSRWTLPLQILIGVFLLVWIILLVVRRLTGEAE